MMVKLLVILLFGLMFEAIGVVFLKQGLEQVGEIKQINTAEIARVVRAGATNTRVLSGVLFEAAFFGCLLVLMSKSDANVSFIWPLTALGFVFTTLAAKFYLREDVHWIRWGGIILIMIGAALVSYSEKMKSKPLSSPTAAPAASPRNP
ncbi:MAG: hypothetical protein DME24_21505 [Verrucomicrobia bacterium]|nr:MAG: hypothetical protein DME24_21505 [Verrucomicrobiota bacterium]